MRERPEIRYAESGDVHIAYQVFGEGAIDVVLVLGWITHLDAMWDYPGMERLLRGLASFSRVIVFDKRGVGLSDRSFQATTLEDRMDDIRAVMDAAGSERAALIGTSEGGPMCLLFAATYPERTSALVIHGGYAARLAQADTPGGPTSEEFSQYVTSLAEGWGSPVLLERLAPSMLNDSEFRSWWKRYLQLGGSPGAVVALGRFYPDIDVRHVLPAIQAPTLVMHARGDRLIPFAYGEAIARAVPGAKLLPIESEDRLIYVGDVDGLVADIQEFLVGVRPAPRYDRVLATVMCTDIVGSTARAAVVGDARWRHLVDRHDDAAGRLVAAANGRMIKSLGDGVLATFDGPARAIRCAAAMRQSAAALGLEVRTGLHAGEIELRDNSDIAGIAVNISARIAALGDGGDILTSRTVKDLVVGSGIEFELRGAHTLKGVPDRWEVFSVVSRDEASAGADRSGDA